MRQLTRKTYMAIEVVLYVALNSGDKTVRSRDIAEYQGVTLRYLEQILQVLVKHKILKGMRGPKGGYSLAKEKRKITLAMIYRAMDSIESVEHVHDTDVYRGAIAPIEEQVQGEIYAALNQTTLLAMCETFESRDDGDVSSGNEFSI